MSESTTWMIRTIQIGPPTLGYPGVQYFYEQCGPTGKYCSIAASGLAGTCGTWLTKPDTCCFAVVYSSDGEERNVACDTIKGLSDTAYDKIGEAEFTVQSNTCPNGSYPTLHSVSDVGGDPADSTAICCKNSLPVMVIRYIPDPEYPDDPLSFQVDAPLRCADLTISPSKEELADSDRLATVSNPTLIESQTPFSGVPEETGVSSSMMVESTSAPGGSRGSTSTPVSNGGATGVSSAGGAAETSSAGSSKKVSFLIVGSAVVALLLGMQL
ncbi:hypothetical protein TWF694_004697 [Orbilia ellipsospora]|uniref:Uncharacterized protein n=1 Tax=Orbilia ellipsospora TaxID=2528407 RepID=A0AAV9WX07_9PEZI